MMVAIPIQITMSLRHPVLAQHALQQPISGDLTREIGQHMFGGFHHAFYVELHWEWNEVDAHSAASTMC